MWIGVGYIAIMEMFRTTTHMRRPWRLLLGLLCVGLVLLMGTMAATHTHMDRADHPDCGLCVAAHLAVQLSAPPPQVAISPVHVPVETTIPVLCPRTIARFGLFTRPPPVRADLS